MQNYKSYNTKDFILDDAFCRWVLQKSETDNQFWNQWLLENSEKSHQVMIAKEIILKIQSAQNEITESELNDEIQRFSEKRKQLDNKEFTSKPNIKVLSWLPWFKYAAVLAIAIIGFALITNQDTVKKLTFSETAYDKRTKAIEKALVEVSNDGNHEKMVKLPDGSQVLLSKNSKISYPNPFGVTQRSVYLSGEAFFEVVKNPSKPFVVYANELATRVLGTSFTISSYDKADEVKVIVKTGKVAVFPLGLEDEVLDKKPEMMLTPNQKVVFNRIDNQMKRSLVEIPEPLKNSADFSKYLVFENSPVTKVFEKLFEVYNIPIVYDNALMENCRITAELGNQPLFEKLDLICRAIDAKYEVIDGQIVIHAKKCN
ncbi:FecR family protein [Flectobacillus roseus]|uniref:FecR family protein n=1 Tax=Flectobacillus roseus TaxID=502259 RepID=UPI0024B73F97|nr:FecR family protein [Flectobacillus roseus]MDI9871393.1 FecR domain-containing protein [Flectobacillus roseus]